ncbi:unnamed protein product [Didymodactylos carnosus]|uniref:Uncharacterized protein n=1 Tax=Didymodactylos carnosus TaxID=1234261 RepID=A0A815VW25_9BILA|nr:unnamed protein product [Didymodactylos carnosus]CAF4395346.1 unnamed protein product [Didymodactylos carnosus]
MFVPSIQFIAQLNIVDDRILPTGAYCRNLKFADIPKQHPKSNHPYSPDIAPSENLEAFKYWIQFADFYQLPYIQTFDSWDDLIVKLAQTNFQSVHDQMMTENLRRRTYLIKEWLKIIDQIEPNRTVPQNYKQAIKILWETEQLQST